MTESADPLSPHRARWGGCLGRLAALGFGLLMALALVEIAARVALGFEPLPRWAQDFNSRVGYELLPNDEYTYVSASNEFENVVRTNSRGLHDVEHDLNKPDGVFRVLILADSYGQSREVPLEINFARQLEGLLNATAPTGITFEVINAGQFGLGTTQEYLYYTVEGHRYAPDLVLLGFYVGNDVIDNHAPLSRVWLGTSRLDFPYFDPDGTLHQPGMATGRRILSWLRQNVYLVYTLSGSGHPDRVEMDHVGESRQETRLVPMGVYQPPDAEWTAGWAVTAHAVSELKAAVENDGARLAVFVIPDRRQLYDSDWQVTLDELPELDPATLDRERPTRAALALFEEQAVPALSLLEPFRAVDGRVYYQGDGHFNPAGHTLVAHELATWLLSTGLAPQEGQP